MKYVAFRSASDMLSALTVCRHAIPETVFHVSTPRWKSAWALPLEYFDSQDSLQRLKRQFGWDVGFGYLEEGLTPVPIFKALSSAWTYQDPFGGFLSGSETDISYLQRRENISYDLSNRHVEYSYLLGASDETESQTIVNALTENLVRGITGTPIFLDTVEGDCPFEFFWLVRWKRPNPIVFEQASRVWWGPLQCGNTKVYLQWPYSLGIPVEVLQAMPWGERTAYVLLSKDTPNYLLLHRNERDAGFHEIQDVARLTTTTASVSRVTLSSPSRISLKVRIRLVNERPENRLASRKAEIVREIKAKTQILEQLRNRSESHDSVIVSMEPLLLFESENSNIPDELRRLLIEWADLDNDLRSIYYLCLQSDVFPKGKFQANLYVHVVTTGKALGKDTAQVGVRLWEYAQDAKCFNLCPEWARFGVKIFTPDQKHPELYPDMRPSVIGAKRLAETLLPGSSADAKSEWIAVLMTDYEGQLHDVQMQISDFQPICNVWEWNCRVNVQVDAPAQAEQYAKNALPEVWKSVETSFLKAVQNETDTRINSLVDSASIEIKRINENVESIRSRIHSEREHLISTQVETDLLRLAMLDCGSNASAALSELKKLSGDTRALDECRKLLEQVVEKIISTRQEIEKEEHVLGMLLKSLNNTSHERQ